MTDDSTNMTEDWVRRAWVSNPNKLLGDGNIRTGPVRLSFPHLFTPQKNDEGKEKFSATFLFPLGTDMALLKKAATEAVLEKWPKAADMTLHSPFRDQREKQQWEGYEPGAVFITCTGDRRPLTVDARGAAIVDETALYPGCWVLGLMRPFTFDRGVKKGVSFGLQGLIKLADDKDLGGGGVDLGAAIQGIAVDQSTDLSGAFAGAGESDVVKSLF